MRLVALTVVLLASAVASLFMGVRSRLRVRKMLSEGDVQTAACAIDRPAVQGFFSETQILRALVEDVLVNPNADASLDDDAQEHRRSNLDRLFGDWHKMFTEQLDDEDRDALRSYGVTKGRIESAVKIAHLGEWKWQHKVLRELQDLETRMTTGQVGRGYR